MENGEFMVSLSCQIKIISEADTIILNSQFSILNSKNRSFYEENSICHPMVCG